MEHTISGLMAAVERGDLTASETLFSALYAELHRLAKRQLAQHGSPSSLGAARDPSSPDRARFMGYADPPGEGGHAQNLHHAYESVPPSPVAPPLLPACALLFPTGGYRAATAEHPMENTLLLEANA